MTARIVICDDDAFFSDMVRGFLDGMGYRAIHCLDINELRYLIEGNPPDLVILDMQIGGGGGPAGAALIPAAMPIIVVSGMPVEQQRVWFKNREAIRFFQKPLDIQALGKAVYDLLPRAA